MGNLSSLTLTKCHQLVHLPNHQNSLFLTAHLMGSVSILPHVPQCSPVASVSFLLPHCSPVGPLSFFPLCPLCPVSHSRINFMNKFLELPEDLRWALFPAQWQELGSFSHTSKRRSSIFPIGLLLVVVVLLCPNVPSGDVYGDNQRAIPVPRV